MTTIRTANTTDRSSADASTTGGDRSDQSGSGAGAEGAEGDDGLVLMPVSHAEQLGPAEHFWPEVDPFGAGFRGREAVDIAASMFPRVDVVKQGRLFELTEIKERSFVISPGSFQVKVESADPGGPEDDWTDHPEGCTCDRCGIWGDGSTPVQREPQLVGEFSYKARLRMMNFIASVDWPEVIQPGERLAMVTLTYPNNWRACAPTPDATMKHLTALESRYRRAAGRNLRFVWVREFQARGAPHFHLMASVPMTLKGVSIREWFARNWSEVVASDDQVLHYERGTSVDWKEALSWQDPKYLAKYFGGYSNGKDKSYQHDVPQSWQNENGSVGRFWGRRKVERCTSEVRVTDRHIVEAKRIARKVVKAQKRRVTRMTKRVNRETGEVTFRRSTRWFKLKSLMSRQARKTGDGGERGFTLFVNDGPLFAIQMARALAIND